MKKIRFAIIGCGRISYRHIEAIENNPNAELVALCDLNIEKAKERAGERKIPLYRDYHEMLTKEDIDVVNIMTPSGMHVEHASEIIQTYKKHVVVEKPMALKVSDGRALIDIAKKHNVQLFAVHQNRFNKAITKIKSAIDQNLFGKIIMGTIRIRWSRPQRYYNRDPWRGTWALDGGALTNQSIHHIDLLRWLVGDVDSISAIGATQLVDIEVEDTAMSWLRFKNGALGSIEATTGVRPENLDLEASISILGEKGVVVVEGFAVNKLLTWTFDDGLNKEEFSENPPNLYGYGHNVIVDNVVDTLLGKASPLITGEDALESVKLLSGIYRSIELDGKEVQMKDNPVSQKLGVITKDAEKIADLYRTNVVLAKS